MTRGLVESGALLQELGRSEIVAVVASRASDGTVVYANDLVCTIMGTGPGNLVGRSMRDFYAEASDRERVVGELRERGFIKGVQFRGRRHDGELRWVLSSMWLVLFEGEPAIAAISHDITERKAAEEAQTNLADALRESEARYRHLVELSPDAMLVHCEGKVVYANEACVRVFRADSAESLLGVAPLEFVEPEHRAAVAERMRNAYEAGVAAPLMEERLRRLDGTVFTAEVRGTPNTWRGKPAVQLLIRDVTESRELQAKIALLDRTVSLGTLAAGVGHEINNPLTAVLGAVDLGARRLRALQQRLSPEQGAEVGTVIDLLAAAREATLRIREIVKDLKTLSRVDDEGPAMPISIPGAIDYALGIANNEIRHRAVVVRDVAHTPPVLGNEGRLRQVFVNLLVNAAQAIPEGEPNHEIRVRTGTSEGRVWVEIEDTGSGIAPDALAQIFDPFFTTKPVGQGSGLGLAISKRIVNSLGGELTAASTPGEGSTFRVTLPAGGTHRAVPERKASASMMQAVKSSRPSVLVIDDEPLVCDMMRRMLAGVADVQTVADAEAAVTLLVEGDTAYDRVLCDVMMPKLSGFEVHARVARERPDVAARFVLVTGGAFTPRTRAQMASTPLPVLEKPFSLSQLVAAVHGIPLPAG